MQRYHAGSTDSIGCLDSRSMEQMIRPSQGRVRRRWDRDGAGPFEPDPVRTGV